MRKRPEVRASAGGRRGIMGRAVGGLIVVLALAEMALAQQPGAHWQHQGVMPPGAIGSWQLQRGGPIPGYFQPVEIRVPEGASLSLSVDGRFEPVDGRSTRVGLLVGQVYRLAVFNIPFHAGLEVFPTIELIDRLYTPRGQERRFAIPIDLTQQDLELAVSGKFVTRVIYLEDPQNALPAREAGTQNWFDAAPGQDPLVAADALGRPVAILRLGARVPSQTDRYTSEFFFGCPPMVLYTTATYTEATQPVPQEVPQQTPTLAPPVSSGVRNTLPSRSLPVWHDPEVGSSREGQWR